MVAGLLSDDSQDLEKSRNQIEESFSRLNLSNSFSKPVKANLKELIKKAQGQEKKTKVVKQIKVKRGRSETGTSGSSANNSFTEKKKTSEAYILELGKQKLRELEKAEEEKKNSN